MGPGVGAQRRGACARRMSDESIMTALAPLESRHPCLGQSLWWLWVMRPRCLHAHAAPAGVLVCPAGRPGEVSLPSVASSPRAGGRTGSGRRTPLGLAPPPLPPPLCLCLYSAASGVSPGLGSRQRMRPECLAHRAGQEAQLKPGNCDPNASPRSFVVRQLLTICETF